MRRFIDLRNNPGVIQRFAFFDTVINKFSEFSGEQAWTTKEEFFEAFDNCESNKSPLLPSSAFSFVPVSESHEELVAKYRKRFESLMPDWVSIPESEEEFEKRLDGQ